MNNLNVTNLKSINAAKYDNGECVTRDLNIHSDLSFHLPAINFRGIFTLEKTEIKRIFSNINMI